MPRDFPRRNDLVVATVLRVEEHGVVVSLDEYRGLQGYIPRGHVASGRIKDIRDFVREGDRVVGRVIRADRSKGHVDLSLRYVSREQARRKLEEWKERSRIVSLLRVAASRAGSPDPEGDAVRAWETLEEAAGDVVGILEEAAEEGAGVLTDAGLPPKVAEELLALVREHFKPPLYENQVLLRLFVPTSDGIEAIRSALGGAERYNSDKVRVEAFSAGAPRYVLKVYSTDPTSVKRTTTLAVKRVLEEVRRAGGVGEVVGQRESKRRAA